MFCENIEIPSSLGSDRLFDRFWNVNENWVEEPNQRRRGRSGVISATFNQEAVFIKKQVNHLHRCLRFPLGRPTALREAEALAAMRKIGVMVPDTIYCATRRVSGKQQTVLVTRGLPGFVDLDFFLARESAMSASEHLEFMVSLASTLVRMHRHRWQHSSLYGKHILVRRGDGRFEVVLIDLEKMRRRITVGQASRHDLDQLSRHQKGWDCGKWQEFLKVYRNILQNGLP